MRGVKPLRRSMACGRIPGTPARTPICQIGCPMDSVTIKTPNPKCRLYWCKINFIVRRYNPSCWYLVWTIALLTFSVVSSSPLPCVNKYFFLIFSNKCTVTVYTYTVCKGGGGMGSNAGRGPQTDKTTVAKSFYGSIFLDNDIWHSILWV